MRFWRPIPLQGFPFAMTAFAAALLAAASAALPADNVYFVQRQIGASQFIGRDVPAALSSTNRGKIHSIRGLSPTAISRITGRMVS
ncbi:MAG TPA: hypothetical protein VK797_01655 [Tepidisphaeraceae bacterium]|nr:hypothetical protein [Tepidisphaeraceae bacterium]